MRLESTILQLSLLTVVSAAAVKSNQPRAAGGVKWGPCTINGTLPVDCGNITVPLDYSNTSSKATLDIGLLRVPASKTPKKGTILFNFGGPGLPSRGSLAARAKQFQVVTGGSFDLVAWDPRGTGRTLTFSCFNNATERSLAGLAYQSPFGNATDRQMLGRTWAVSSTYSEICAINNPEALERGSLIGTSYSARDLKQIAEALEDDGFVRYWGLSYGTALGAIFVSMFPDRVDRVILDGVMNPHQYLRGVDVEILSDTDATFSEFFKNCVKAPTKCSLAQRNISASALEATVYNAIEDIKNNPISYQLTIIDYSLVLNVIRRALYNTSNWPILSLLLDALIARDPAKFTKAQAALPVTFGEALGGDESATGIHCGDKGPRAKSLEDVMPGIRALGNTSRLIGPTVMGLVTTCAQWRYQAKERYQGDFRVKTRHPVLVIGNTWDPATPLRSARNISATLEGSVVLEQHGYGHCSPADPSVCTAKAIRKYFEEGVLPQPGTVCEPNFGPFENKTILDILPLLSETSPQTRSVGDAVAQGLAL